MKSPIVMLVSSLMLLMNILVPTAAQDYTEQDVIDMVTSQMPFSYGLQTVSDWSAAAYDTGNTYGIWRVQFWDGEGEEIAWANIAPERGRLYNYEAVFSSTDAQLQAAEPIVRAYIQSHPDVIALIGDPQAYSDSTYLEYNGWLKAWGVWIDRGDDTLYLIVQFKGIVPDALTDPELIEIGFPNVMSYDEWLIGMHDKATTIAFTDPQIAAVLRPITGWVSEVVYQDEGLWAVTFTDDDTELLTAVVNLETSQMVEWAAP